MTVVIEYCYNSSTRQISTSHNEERYHEEAELVRQYVLHYCPEACVFVVPVDFKTATSFHRGGERTLARTGTGTGTRARARAQALTVTRHATDGHADRRSDARLPGGAGNPNPNPNPEP